MAGIGRMLKALEKEIEFYKEITGRLTTALFFTLGGTVATLKKSGWEVWALAGAVTSIILSLALFLNMRKWEKKIEELKSCDNGGN
ncbi:hypothetical protein [Desulfurobacterium sp.]